MVSGLNPCPWRLIAVAIADRDLGEAASQRFSDTGQSTYRGENVVAHLSLPLPGERRRSDDLMGELDELLSVGATLGFV